LYLIFKTSSTVKNVQNSNSKFNLIIILALALTIIQVVLGTTVREFIDHIAETGAPKIMWLQSPKLSFYIHRSFSIVVLLTNCYLFYTNRKLLLGFSKINWVMLLICFEILSGIIMSNFYFPFGTQTIHIVLASLIFGIQFYLVLETQKNTLN